MWLSTALNFQIIFTKIEHLLFFSYNFSHLEPLYDSFLNTPPSLPPKCPDNSPSSNNFNTFLPPSNNSPFDTPVKHLHVNIVLKDRFTTKAIKQNSTSGGPSSGVSRRTTFADEGPSPASLDTSNSVE